jgi:bifunctional non-homologous end joining protein LigD
LVAFDLLELDGETLVDEPYAARRESLADLGLNGPRWATTTADGDGEAVWTATEELGLEGVVCKDPRSTSVPRRSQRWLKCKHWRYGTFRVMGWAPSTGREPAGLVVGAPGAGGELRLAGVAALNVDREARATVMALMDSLHRPAADDRPPLATPGAMRRRRPGRPGALPGADAVAWLRHALARSVGLA